MARNPIASVLLAAWSALALGARAQQATAPLTPQPAGGATSLAPPTAGKGAAKSPAAAGQEEFNALDQLVRPRASACGWRPALAPRDLYSEMLAVAWREGGPALAWCARHLPQAAPEAQVDLTLGFELYARLARDHGAEAWLAEARWDPLRSVAGASNELRTALALHLPGSVAPDHPGAPLALLIAAQAGLPRDDAERRARELDGSAASAAQALASYWVRFPDHPWSARASRLSWQVVHLAPGAEVMDWTSSDVDGNELRLGDFLGRPLLVDVWSPEDDDVFGRVALRQRVRARYPAQRLAILGVGLASDRERFRRQVEELDLTWPTTFEGPAAEGADAARSAWRLDGGARTFLIDARGTILATDLEGERLERALSELLDAPPACAPAEPRPEPDSSPRSM